MSAAVRKRIGVVPQYDAVHERLTVSQALTAAAKLRVSSDTPRAAVDAAVAETAATLGLDGRLGTRVAKLSGGQKKRVSVGYELVADPIMMVLDEPTSGLDPGLEQELIAELRAMADRGTTTIVVTHSTEAAEQADLVVVMAPGGHVVFVGPPAAVLTTSVPPSGPRCSIVSHPTPVPVGPPTSAVPRPTHGTSPLPRRHPHRAGP